MAAKTWMAGTKPGHDDGYVTAKVRQDNPAGPVWGAAEIMYGPQVACCPCFETLASQAPQHEVVVFPQVKPHPEEAAKRPSQDKRNHL
jgi:hypothetical protein